MSFPHFITIFYLMIQWKLFISILFWTTHCHCIFTHTWHKCPNFPATLVAVEDSSSQHYWMFHLCSIVLFNTALCLCTLFCHFLFAQCCLYDVIAKLLILFVLTWFSLSFFQSVFIFILTVCLFLTSAAWLHLLDCFGLFAQLKWPAITHTHAPWKVKGVIIGQGITEHY